MATIKWVLDPAHSEIVFKVKHMMISNVKGEFKNFDVEVNSEDITNAAVKVSINADSVDTKNADRDAHLKSEDFFNTAKFPELLFESTAVEKVDDEEYKLKGNLTIKGISKEVKLDVEFGGIAKDPWGNEKAGFAVSGKINRKDWGLNWNAALETGGVLVSEEVKFNAEVQFVKQVS